MDFEIFKPSKKQLNDFVSENEYSTIFQSGDILDIYENTPRCTPISLAALNNKGKIVATLIGVAFQEKGGIFKYFSSHATIRGGPIYINNEEGKKAASFLIKKYIEGLGTEILYSRIYPMYNINNSDLFLTNKYNLEAESNVYIDLDQSEEELWKKMHKMKRKAISKAHKNNVQVDDVKDKHELVLFYELLKETYKRNNLQIRDFALFENIFNKLVPKGLAKIVLATYNDKPIAGRLVLTYNQRIYDWYAGSNSQFLHLRPNDLLVWNIISWGANNNFNLFDFGGAGNPNETYHVRDFKVRFGGELENYGRYTNIIQPKTFKLCNNMYKYYQRYNLWK